MTAREDPGPELVFGQGGLRGIRRRVGCFQDPGFDDFLLSRSSLPTCMALGKPVAELMRDSVEMGIEQLRAR